MASLERKFILGRLGQTRQTHKGSPTVQVDKTMDNAASRTGIVPDHVDPDSVNHHESVMEHMTARLGLRPDEVAAEAAEAGEAATPAAATGPEPQAAASAANPASEPKSPGLQRVKLTDDAEAQRTPADTDRRTQGAGDPAGIDPTAADARDPRPGPQPTDDDLHREQSRQALARTLKALDLEFHHDPHTEEHHERERRLHHKHRRKRRRRKHSHRKTTFNLCSRTLRCLKAYAKITGRWQYNLVGEALESYLELAVTALDRESLHDMREILRELHGEDRKKTKK